MMAEEDITYNLNFRSDNATKSVRDMRQEIKALNQAMSDAGARGDTVNFDKFKSRIGALKNDMVDLNRTMKASDPGELLSGYVKLTQGLVGSFGAVTASMSLFGSKSEEIQAIEQKSMQIIQLMMGLEKARQILIDQGGRAEIKQIFLTTVGQVKKINLYLAEALSIKVVEGATTKVAAAQRLWNIAMAANPILMIVAAVAALAAGIYLLTQNTEDDTEAQAAHNAELEKYNELLDAGVAAQTSAYNTMAASRIAAGDAQDIWNKKAQLELDFTSKQSQATEQLTKDYKEAYKKRNEMADTDYESTKNRLFALKELDRRYLADKEELEANYQKAYLKTLKDLEDETAKKEKEDRKKKYDEWKKEQKIQADNYMELQNDMYKLNATEKEKEIADAKLANVRWEKQMQERYKNNKQSYVAQTGSYKQFLEDQHKLDVWSAQNRVESEKLMFSMQSSMFDAEIGIKIDAEVMLQEKLKEIDLKYWQIELAQEQKMRDERKAWDDEVIKEAKERDAKLVAEQVKYIADLDRINKRDVSAEKQWAQDKESRDSVAYQNEIDRINEKYDIYSEYYKGLTNLGISATEIEERRQKELTKHLRRTVEERAWIMIDNVQNLMTTLTDIETAKIEQQDTKWQKSQEDRMSILKSNADIEKATYGEMSSEYLASLEIVKQGELDKIEHDKKISAEKKEAQKKYAEFQLALTIASTTANVAEAVANAMTTKPFILAALQVAAAVADGAAQIAAAKGQYNSIQSMAKGGLINGPSHSQGGVFINAEGGEGIVNARSMSNPRLAKIVSDINVSGGGSPMVNSGSIGGGIGSSIATIDPAIIEEIVKQIAAIPVVVTESDISKTQRKVEIYESNSKI